MKNIALCGACKVPLTVSRELEWEANGVISLNASPKNRMVFFESETIDRLFHVGETGESLDTGLTHMSVFSKTSHAPRLSAAAKSSE